MAFSGKGIGGEIKETADKVLGEPFTVPIRWIEGEKGPARRIAREAAGSIVSLPFRVTREAVKGVLSGTWQLTKFLLGALPIPLLTPWRTERKTVQERTKTALADLRETVEQRRTA